MRVILAKTLGLLAAIALPMGAQVRYTPADVRFMQGMIDHHAQALVMTGLIAARTTRPEIRALGERIMVSQRDEIAAMRRWLLVRHEHVPPADVEHGHVESAMRMPGMLSEAEMVQLEDARGADFDRLFVTFMIKHHEGAISMVKDLFATQGAGQESETFRFASDVEADQRAEIARMRPLLKTLTQSPSF